MAFVKLLPGITRERGDYTGDKVRISFPVKGEIPHLIMNIGKDVAKRYGFELGDRVAVLLDGFRMQLVKDPKGWKLIKQGNNFRLQMAWREKIPKGWGKVMKYVNVALVDGNLEITFPNVVEDVD